MKATGIVRRIDDLGRIVVPKEIRRTLRIREGDPLEIFTSREGEIMLKKYSPVGELGEFARSYAQALAQTTEALVCITDREYVIAAAGTGKKEVEGEQLSEEMEAMIEKRSTVVKTGEEQACSITKKTMSTLPKGIVLSSILCNGDFSSRTRIFFIWDSCKAYSSSAPIPSVISPVSLCTVSPVFASQYAYMLILPYLPRIYPRYSGNTQLLSDHRHGCFPPFVYRQLFVPPGGFYDRCAQ